MRKLGKFLYDRHAQLDTDLEKGPDAEFVEKYIVYWQILNINGWDPPEEHNAMNNHYDVTWVTDDSGDPQAYIDNSRFEFTWAETEV